MQSRTEAILGQFADSWVETERFFDNLINNYNFERLKPVRFFISELKKKAGDGFFRLGTSVHRLLISRSVNHGLRIDQKYIMIEAYDKKFEVTLRDGKCTYRQYMIENLDLNDHRLTNLLSTLKEALVD
jgi:hypothetical protein